MIGIFWAAGSSWIATVGLTLILILLFVGGIVALLFGVRDLLHDIRQFLRNRSQQHNNQHASL